MRSSARPARWRPRSRRERTSTTARGASRRRTSTRCGAPGIGSLSLPEAHGGPGANLRTTAAAVRAVAAGDASTALVWVMHLIYLQVLADDSFGVDPAVRAPGVRLRAGRAGAHQRAARRARARHAGPRRRPGDARAVRDRRTAGRVSGHKIFSTGSVRPALDGRLGGDDRGRPRRAAQRAVPRARPTRPASRSSRPGTTSGCAPRRATTSCFEDTPIPLDHAAALLPAGRVRPRPAHGARHAAG